jgi:uncharacterized protein YgbK (DUF1537 family)
MLGVIADDVTGGTDLASTLGQVGLEVVQTIGPVHSGIPAADAVIASLKIRTIDPDEACAMASNAAAALRGAGSTRIYFKYCSTFDSTDRGNIGPVTERLLADLGAPFTVSTPAYPSLGRTVYAGHLFVNGRLLSESSMKDHPLTPMRDSDLVRVLGRQSRGRVGLVPLEVVEAGVAAVRVRCAELEARGCSMAIVDAVFDTQLDTVGEACLALPLVTGAAGLGRSLARAIPRHPRGAAAAASAAVRPGSPAAVISGSCSAATQAQVERLAGAVPSRRIDPIALARSPNALDSLVTWACAQASRGDLLLFSTASADEVGMVQGQLGREEAARLVEDACRTVAAALAEAGVRTFVIAGGETAGAVLDALGIRMLGFGVEIEPGVPWTRSLDPSGFQLALKSGNFGSPEFFLKALGRHP